ncbi:MAG: hypothetical protein AB2745_08650 [Candidatus Thiodiazotropha endolucinida]
MQYMTKSDLEAERQHALEMALSFNRDETCQICGKLIGDELDPVIAGFSETIEIRLAHQKCMDGS